MRNTAGQHKPHDIHSSIENAAAEVSVALESLPLEEMDAIVAHTENASELLQAAAAESTAPEAVDTLAALTVAADSLRSVHDALRSGVTELTAYSNGVSQPMAGSGRHMDPAAYIKAREARVVPPEVLYAADTLMEQLLPMAEERSPAQYMRTLEDQPDDVLCELLRRNVPFVDHVLIVRHYGLLHKQAVAHLSSREPHGLEVGDLVAAVLEDYINACRGYKGGDAKLTSYTGPYTWFAMSRAFNDEAYLVDIPAHINSSILGRIHRIDIERLERGEPPMSDLELAAMFDLPLNSRGQTPKKRTVVEMRQAIALTSGLGSIDVPYVFSEVHVDSPPGNPYRREAYGRIANVDSSSDDPAEVHFERALRTAITVALAELSDREAAILRARYGFEDHVPIYDELADQWGVSRQRIQQIEHAALEKLAELHPHLLAFLQNR